MTTSYAQRLALALIPKFSGSISIFFSSLIVYSILRKEAKHRNAYDRLILGVSVADLLGSFWMAMSTWPIPDTHENGHTPWAVGTQATCDAQGFFTQGATIASVLYMGSLTVYFLLVVRFRRKAQQLRHYECLFHIIPIGWGISTGTATILLKLSNNANLWCYISPSPDPERGHRADFFRMLFFYGPLFGTFVLVTLNVVIIVSYVRGLTTRALRASTRDRSGELALEEEDIIDDDDEEEEGGEEEKDQVALSANGDEAEEARHPKSPVRGSMTSSTDMSLSSTRNILQTNKYAHWRRKVSRQNLRFALAFYFTWIPISCVRMLQLRGTPVPFWLTVIAAITTPMQGLPNLLIYFYPKYKKFRKQQNHQSEKFNLLHWIQAGMVTTPAVVSPRQNQEPPADYKAQTGILPQTPNDANNNTNLVLPWSRHVANKKSPDMSPIVPLRKHSTAVISQEKTTKRGMRFISSISVSSMEPIEESESARTVKWGGRGAFNESPLKLPARAVSEASIAQRKVSFREDSEDSPASAQGNRSSCSTPSRPSSILKDSQSNDSVSVLTDNVVSIEVTVNSDDESTGPEQGDPGRWNPVATQTDNSPRIPRRMQSMHSDSI